jgi:hypothetical protein
MDNIHRLAGSAGGVLRTHYRRFYSDYLWGRTQIPRLSNHHEHRRAMRNSRKTCVADFRRRESQLLPQAALPLLRALGVRVALFVPTDARFRARAAAVSDLL